MVKELLIDLDILHKHKLSVALVHGFIRKEADERGYTLAGKKFIVLRCPDIADGIGLSRITTWRAVKTLIDEGYVERIKIKGSRNSSYAVM